MRFADGGQVVSIVHQVVLQMFLSLGCGKYETIEGYVGEAVADNGV